MSRIGILSSENWGQIEKKPVSFKANYYNFSDTLDRDVVSFKSGNTPNDDNSTENSKSDEPFKKKGKLGKVADSALSYAEMVTIKTNKLINKKNSTIAGIPNSSKIDNNYYRGSQPDKKDLEELAKFGIKTIISLRSYNSFSKKQFKKLQNYAESLGMNYINIPMNSSEPPTKEQIDDFIKIIDNADSLPVYVHCAEGKDRTGIMTALYRVHKYSWDFDKAYDEMKKYCYHEKLFPKQKHFLSQYIENLSSSKSFTNAS